MNSQSISAIVRAIRNTEPLSMEQAVEVAEYIAAKHQFLADAINDASNPYKRGNGSLQW